MKKILIFAAFLAAMVSCGPKQVDPMEQALIDKIIQAAAEEGKVSVYKMEKVDSTTFRTELERKFKIYNLKIEQNQKFYDTYMSQRKPKNAELKKKAIEKDKAIIAGLEEIQEQISDQLDNVAYYDYKFSASANFKSSKATYNDYFCAITPDGKVLGISSDQNVIHKGTSSVIPGYKALLDSSDIGEPEPLDPEVVEIKMDLN